jgi:exosortase
MTQLSASHSVGYSDPLTPDASPSRTQPGLSGATWGKIGLIAALLAGLFWPNLRRLWLKTNPVSGEPNWQHSVFVPLIGLYYLYLNREALLKPWTVKAWSGRARAWGAWLMLQAVVVGTLFFGYAYFRSKVPALGNMTILGGAVGAFAAATLAVLLATTAGSANRKKADRSVFARLSESSGTWFGLFAMLWGIGFYAWSIWPGQNDFFKDCAIVAVLFGAVLMTCGWRVMHTAWFPIVFLLCAIPWPGLVYSWIALPLQKLAATGATWVLQLTGVEAVRFGTKMRIGSDLPGVNVRWLNVADACAGLKSLMTFICVGAAVGFLSSRAMWQKVIITASAVPIAILCNVIRVSGQGLLDTYASPKWSESFAHQFVGMIMLIPAFFMILFVGWLLDHIFVDEVERRAATAKAAAAPTVIEVPRNIQANKPVAPAAARPMGIAPRTPAPKPAAAAAPAVAKPAATTVAKPPAAKPAVAAPVAKPAAAPVAKPPVAAPVAKPPAAPAAKPPAPAAPARSMAARPVRRPATNPPAAPKPTTNPEEGKQ